MITRFKKYSFAINVGPTWHYIQIKQQVCKRGGATGKKPKTLITCIFINCRNSTNQNDLRISFEMREDGIFFDAKERKSLGR